MARRCVILGNGGHAAVLARWLGLPGIVFIENDSEVIPNDVVYIGVGWPQRIALYQKFRPQVPDLGRQIIYADARDAEWIGENVLINRGAQVDHGCVIEDHCVISPGAILCGEVTLGPRCFIGAGAIILEGVNLEPDTFIPAGTLVVGPNDLRRPQRVVRPV